MPNRSFVIGVGMTKFEKPGRREGWDYPDIGREAATNALLDAGVPYDCVQHAFLAYCYGDSTSGQRALYEVGLTGIPMVNVNNNCATGSTALYLANQYVHAGIADCVLALGFEKMERGSLRDHWADRTAPTGRHIEAMAARRGLTEAPTAAQIFGNAGREYMERHGVSRETIAKIAVKNHRHSVNNPYSQFRDEYSLEEILASAPVYDPLTKLQCCPTSDGGAAVVVASESFVQNHGLRRQAVEIVGQALTTDTEELFDGSDASLVGYHMTAAAARAAYEQSGLGPEDVQVIELHDCFSTNELVTYDALGLCQPGRAGALVEEGAVDYGGKWVVNPSGGLISKGHPLGATGLAQCAELTWQLRGTAAARQVEGATAALQHNIGVGGAAVVTIYRTAEDL
ncbi:MAG: lipid-transfer protein [Pseudonocardia sp.]|uniref:lipid-transfer protein n=1 Tax=unclassified Pseudonocardia TaxID=2619320 RepID=UPI0008693CA1|nr:MULTISPECIES: lipid-transfer protein [unclassified Pseudonocardia]MBN9109396.1 lipid-transfer protein [Pseudonocardia sp.]ODU29958.1 MAG: lipid-transfer protein [Pseudonocardia sp. SCN 72-51]ODV08105.1 MAG: lipid-transfer protein [Pseudonocardia sp. SCN 73-27]